MIVEKTVRKFIRELASNRPIPGGGNVSALVAAQAAGLVSMACEISLRKEVRRGTRKHLRELGASARILCEWGLVLTEWDAEVFKRLIACFRKRYGSSGKRRQTIQKALMFCTAACLDLALLSREGMKLSRRAIRSVKPDMRSELHTAVHFWEAAFQGARVNTEANLGWVRDASVKNRVRALIREVWADLKQDRTAALKVLQEKGKKR